MKALILVTALIAAQAFGYNTEYTPVKFGHLTLVEAEARSSYQSNVVSLVVELNSKTGNYPLVQISSQDQTYCSHKQTLIMFSGYDYQTKTHKRVYEVQIDRNNLSKSCFVRIFASNSAQDKANAASVAIVPGK